MAWLLFSDRKLWRTLCTAGRACAASASAVSIASFASVIGALHPALGLGAVDAAEVVTAVLAAVDFATTPPLVACRPSRIGVPQHQALREWQSMVSWILPRGYDPMILMFPKQSVCNLWILLVRIVHT